MPTVQRYLGTMREFQFRRRGMWIAKIAVSVGLSIWLGSRMMEREGFEALIERVERVDGGWIAVAIALHFAAVLIGVVRWRLLLRASAIELPFSFLTRSYLIGRFVGAFTPSTAGLDGWRLWEVGRASGSMGGSAAAILVEKLVGLISMALVCALLLPFGGAALIGESALVLALALALGATIALSILGRPKLLEKIAARSPLMRARAMKIAASVGTSRLGAARIGRAIALGVVSHAAISSVFYATARALGLDVDTLTLLSVGNAITIAVLIPISVGGVGVRESVAVVLLAGAGVVSTEAVLVALLGYVTGQAPALIGGVCLALARRPATEAPSALATQA